MHTNLLVDAIMRQTTVLIAQLAATSGIRAPVAHLADEVFLNLSKELEDQGLSRKVVADMFGLALRSYQRRVQRLQESETEARQSLWMAIFEYVDTQNSVTRGEVFERFRRDSEENVMAVLSDLVATGLASRTGTGESALYAATSEDARRRLALLGREETASSLVLLHICNHPNSKRADVAEVLGLRDELVEQCLQQLMREGQVSEEVDGSLKAESVVIPVGAEVGWEAAVFDHFQAMTAALVVKLRQGKTRSTETDTVGGGTLTFQLHDDHPLLGEVLEQLPRIRDELIELWERVEAINAEHPISDDEEKRVIFYFGQLVKGSDL